MSMDVGLQASSDARVRSPLERMYDRAFLRAVGHIVAWIPDDFSRESDDYRRLSIIGRTLSLSTFLSTLGGDTLATHTRVDLTRTATEPVSSVSVSSQVLSDTILSQPDQGFSVPSTPELPSPGPLVRLMTLASLARAVDNLAVHQ